MLKFEHILVLGAIIGIIVISNSSQVAYGHGCQAQGACCSVGSSCVEANASSPIFFMFIVLGLGALMFAFYDRKEYKNQLGAIFNIFK